MNPSRRRFMGTSAAAGAVAALGTDSFFASIAKAAGLVDMTKVPSQSAVIGDVKAMVGMGSRYCGSPPHLKFMQSLEDGFSALGMKIDSLNHTTLPLWLPKNVALKDSAGKAIPVGNFDQWSATTGPEGVTGPLAYIGKIDSLSNFAAEVEKDTKAPITVPADLKGKIVLVELQANTRPLDKLYNGHVSYFHDADQHKAFPSVQGPSAPNKSTPPKGFEEDLKKAGAIGLIYAWANISDADAKGQYSRLGSKSIPSLAVVPSTGAKLKEMAQKGESITLTVEAHEQANAPTRTIVATLPGQSTDETIILWTHTDGMNFVEENGGVAILNMMRYFAKLPVSERKRTLVVVAAEGHFAEAYVPTNAWIKERPSLHEKAVALVSIEHMGCSEWLSDPVANTYKPTGKNEVAYTFCPTKAIADIATTAVKDQKKGREAIIDSVDHAVSPGVAVYREVKVPCFGYISVPSYLLADSENGHLAKLDGDLYYEQFLMLIRLVRGLDATPKSVLRPA